MKILVNTSDLILAESLQYLLSEQGYEITLVDSGKDALDKLKQETFDLIVTSSHSRYFSGMEVIAFLRDTLQAATPAIVMAEIESSTRELFDHYDVQLALGKPFDLEELMTSINQIIVKPDEYLAAS